LKPVERGQGRVLALQQIGGTMKICMAIALCAVLAAPLSAQTPKTNTPPPAPITCTSQVSATICKFATEWFSIQQNTSHWMHDVEVVIADEQAFQQENRRITTIWVNIMKITPSRAEQGRQVLSSPYDDVIIFEIGDKGMVKKVVVSSVPFIKKPATTEAGGAKHLGEEADFNSESLLFFSYYISGYVDGAAMSRAHSISENIEMQKK
jgi:hypothetical protein